MSAIPQLPLTISEADLQSTVTEFAELMHWHWAHYFPLQNRRGKWQTPIMGHPGCPDIIMARGGAVLLVELKRHRGKAEPAQRDWLAATGEHGRLWTTVEWNTGEIVRTLRHFGREPITERRLA